MSETKQKTPQEQYADFINTIRAKFNKNATIMQAADSRLEALDYEGFFATYAGLDKDTLVEIVQAQHVKVNETYGLMMQRQQNLEVILKDLTYCNTEEDFLKLKKKAMAIMMANQLRQQGMSEDEIVKAIEKANSGESSIIVQQ